MKLYNIISVVNQNIAREIYYKILLCVKTELINVMVFFYMIFLYLPFFPTQLLKLLISLIELRL